VERFRSDGDAHEWKVKCNSFPRDHMTFVPRGISRGTMRNPQKVIVPRETSCKSSGILIRSARLGETIGPRHCNC
jgi:hypothetical protein